MEGAVRRLRARDVMTTPVYTVGPETPVPEVARLLVERHISGAPVVDETGRLVGIVTEADLLPKEAGPAGLPLTALLGPEAPPEVREHLRRYRGRVVREVMTREVVTATEDTPVQQLAALMLRKRVNRIPIVRGERVVGIVTRNDVLRAFFRRDEDLERAAQETLRDLELDPGRLTIRAREGVLEIRGEVDSPEHARLVELVLRALDGVVDVDVSGIRIVSAPPRDAAR
ncbi:MAG: CBS domain-containing protein [Armatimonadota bacterium]|nr:CBS domain-containing protein [Armatimonadota bacterium]MDR7440454.1 CBS domain-containing protein [Armatimonadota bacterium]MDR7444604.1 CBS domain-containing protein [Armatimonadota bacterium]MDR7569430.1 CBS domain-containing protein [Armatimonadota bacterium]MDR7613687.1 CBS domain-containing protein [Armatimonadota bacterium]